MTKTSGYGRALAGEASDMWGASSARGLHGHVLESLGRRITLGALPPNHQVVPEELAEQFGVSRTVVRDALRMLEGKGLIAARPRTGTRVRPRSDWDALDSDVIRWRAAGPDSASQFEELLDVRGAIEPLAARKASVVDDPDTQAMEAALDDMAAAVRKQDWDDFTEADVAFHRSLLHASGSLVIDRFAEPIEAAIRVRHSLHLVPDVLTTEVLDSHRAILDAIVARDGARAELASRRIVDVAGAETIDSLVARSNDDARSTP
ncbi:FadR/GntR family transcriptional regulator [Streptomyces albipurpureus]|uniref:FadR family transcriptional regulator n=1 Tax=Streptomyces albipurpureus TaxID=2897419 RepID=A0ABT0UG52_9ACTN|nr:FadR/GntR family transcriptional regulator [Streptomyces sp. CWNU-1]MCM2387612.1 FadR family transcriptional regulator [Streptomyces sp. CWNU-1]